MVDDGSPDDCGGICDEWTKKDNRIKVIHKQNGGLSSARNAGINIAKGKYIGFVDGDDFLSQDAYERLIAGFRRYPQVGIVSGIFKRFNEKETYDYRKKWIVTKDKLIPSFEYAKAMIMETSSNSVCNKLFLTEIVKEVMFKEGRNNEDTLFDYYLSKEMVKRNLSFLDIPHYVYYYRVTPDSICHSQIKPLGLDVIANYQEMMIDSKENAPDLYDLIYARYTNSVTWLVDKLYSNPDWKLQYYTKYKQLLDEIPNKYIIHNWSVKKMLLFFIIKYFPILRKNLS